MADLVIHDEDLQLLQGVLALALKELEPLRRAMSNLEHSAVGVPALVMALEEFVAARGGDVSCLGGGITELADGADRVRQGMTAADVLLAGEAQTGP